MKNGTIRIIKRGQERNRELIPAAVKTKPFAVSASITNVVKEWISERKENSRIERVFSADKISSWERTANSPDEPAQAK